MHYYEVWVRSEKYRAKEPLTYKHSELLEPGQIVSVPLKNARVYGIVVDKVAKPTFPTKQIEATLNLPPLPTTTLLLAYWLRDFYACPLGVITGLLLPPRIHEQYLDGPTDASKRKINAKQTIRLTPEQQEALRIINQPDTYLIHGRTGSGKTQVYLELVERTLHIGKSALILSPEIGLTSQLAMQFQERFGDQVIILHSQLTAKQREQAWQTVLISTSPYIVIGPRSALFSPLKNVGLIVVDEAHDQAYKQEQAPYYQAVRVASQLRKIHACTLILGSATPSIVDYHLAQSRGKSIIRMTQLARQAGLTSRSVHIVDLKDRSEFARSPHISSTLIGAIAQSLGRHEQSLLYLNRRGTARVTLCNLCGWQALCPHCDLPLAYHGDTFSLRCHTCGHKASPPLSCPQCGNASISLKSFGTKAIVDEVQRIFPEARVARFDTDSAKNERLEQRYEDIQNGNVDILVGTQMLAKGLDLPKLSTLGVILADSSLYLPDYTAKERTYQLLTQVIGRVGRVHVASQVIVQTYYPESRLLEAALNDDWETFYNGELDERKTYRFPPFSYLLKLSCRRATALSAERTALKVAHSLKSSGRFIHVEEPAPAFHEKSAGAYEWQLVVKSSQRQELLKAVELVPKDWSYDLDPADLL